MLKNVIIPVLFLFGCSGAGESNGDAREPVDPQGETAFFDREPQQVTERHIELLSASDSLFLSEEFEIYTASRLVLSDDELYIVDNSQLKIVTLDPVTFEKRREIDITEGEGPEELRSIGGFDVSGNQMLLKDGELHRVQVRDNQGMLQNEFATEMFLKHVQLINEETMAGFASPIVTGRSEAIHYMSLEGDLLNSIEDVPNDMLTDLMLEGRLVADDNERLYYAGYAEHMLRGWDREGRVIFSVETIEPAPDNINYQVMEGAEQSVAGYNEFGEFSALGISQYGGELFVVHAGLSSHIEPDQRQFVDVYDKTDGAYLRSLELPHRTSSVVVNENHLFSLHRIEDELYLSIYDL